ncbi:MAG: radical SAM family heme chaperone HemW [Nitrospirae bacterium]|nr:radical SAM family heme chaperone HemW [Nitrospirota bacterium]
MTGSLYIHIPFCLSKCNYCDFNSIPFKQQLADRYIHALITEIKNQSKDAPLINTVYIGGGTPTILDPSQIQKIIQKIRQNYNISDDAEISIEANPGTLDRTKLESFIISGINRISIGAQSFIDDELAFMGRRHTALIIDISVSYAREAGFTNISLDLIYGLPKQKVQQWKDNIAKAILLKPDHISTYELTVENGTPLAHDIINGKYTMPDEDDISEMYYCGIDALSAAGYIQYEISNFAKPGYECRHNINYWNRGEYIGVGSGAHSFCSGVRRSNTRDIKKYCELIETSSDAYEDQEIIDEKGALKEIIFLGLRKCEGIDLSVLPNEVSEKIKKAASDLVRSSLVCFEDERMKLTQKGFILSSEVIVRVLSGIE